MKIMFSCIPFPVWPYPPRIMKNLYFILVNCMGWQVCGFDGSKTKKKQKNPGCMTASNNQLLNKSLECDQTISFNFSRSLSEV